MREGKKIGILVVAYNAVTTLTRVLERIPAPIYNEIDEIAVFDDASKDDTYALSVGYKQIKKLEKLNIYLNERNLGYGGNQKRGFKYYIDKGFDVVVLLHGDGQYAPEVLGEIYSPIVEGKADVVLGSRMMKRYGGALKGGMPLYKFIGNKILSTYQNWKLKTHLTEFHSGYRAYSIEGLKKINLDNCTDDFHFDTQIIIKCHHHNLRIIEVPIPTFYGNEICYVKGLKYAGDVIETTRDYIKTIRGLRKSDTYAEFFVQYPLKLYPFSSHSVVLKILNARSNLRILDIGCGNGFLASHIRDDNYKVGVDIVEPNEEINKSFNKYYKKNLNEGLPTELKDEEKFDYILLLDILDYLVDYEKILREAKKYIKEGGKFIISFANIANLYVRLNLLFGRFPYSDRGILDRGHLHFFTYSSIKKLMKKHKFRIDKIIVTPIPMIEILPKPLKNNLGKVLNFLLYIKTRIFKRLLGFQFIVIADLLKEAPKK